MYITDYSMRLFTSWRCTPFKDVQDVLIASIFVVNYTH